MGLFDWFRGNKITSIDVANKILERRGRHNFSMMRLNHLTYLVHCWYLGIVHKPLCNDGAQAWRYGPIMPLLYDHLKKTYKNGSDIVRNPITKNKVEFDKNTIGLIDRVIEVYGDWSSIQLNGVLTSHDSPWSQVCWEGFFAPIPNKIIEDYYSKKSKDNERRNKNGTH